MTLRCKSCGGVFPRTQADGTTYFHVCPPIVGVAVVRAGAAQLVPLADLRPTDEVRVIRAGQEVAVRVVDLQPGDVRVGQVGLPRPDARDERPDPVKAERALEPSGARRAGVTLDDVCLAVGLGVEPVP